VNDERRLVIVEPSPVLQERGDLFRPTGPKELGLSERGDRCVRCARFGLDGNQAEAQLLEEPFVTFASGATKFLEARLNRGLLSLVFDSQRFDVAKGRFQGFCHPLVDHKIGGNLERAAPWNFAVRRTFK
jgi:hypothetical protein